MGSRRIKMPGRATTKLNLGNSRLYTGVNSGIAKLSKLPIAAFALLFSGIGVYTIMHSSAATVYYIATSGNDSNPCTQSQPCLSFNRAYTIAAPGDTVEVATGAYGNQTINNDASKNSATEKVLFRPAAGATVTVNDLTSWASNVHYKDMSIPLTPSAFSPDIRDGDNVIVENFKAKNFYIEGGTNNVTFKGGEYGPFASCGGGSQIKSYTNGGDDANPNNHPKNTVIDGVYFHDYTVPGSCPGAHLDCLHIFYQQSTTVKNSKFVNCAHYGILWGSNGSSLPDNGVAENNFFGTAGVAGLALRGDTTSEHFENMTVRYNSGGLITPQTNQVALINVKWYANVGLEKPPCRSGIDYKYNVWQSGGTCDSTDIQAPAGFVNYNSGDMHLNAGATAIGRGKPGDFPSTDYDGQSRPLNSTPDAGADEYGSGGTAPTCTQTLNSGANVPSAVSSAAAGSTICLNTGSYSGNLSGISKSSMTTVRAADGASVTYSGNISNSRFITMKDMTISGMDITGTSKDITIANNKFTGQLLINLGANANANILVDGNTFDGITTCADCYQGRIQIRNSLNQAVGVTISNNHIGNGGLSDGIQVGAYGAVIGPGNTFEGIRQGGSTAHIDALQLYGASHTTITGNYFRDNDTAIMAADHGDSEVITNNVIDQVGYPAINMKGHTNSRVEHNTTNETIQVLHGNDGAPSSGNIVKNNVAGSLNTVSGAISEESYNQGFGSGTGSSGASPIFVGGGTRPTTWAGWALASNSPGKNAASDGKDKGANYFGSGGTTPPPTGKTGDLNSDNNVNIFDLSILLSNYNKPAAQWSTPKCDLNSDNNVNIFDLSILLSNYGK